MKPIDRGEVMGLADYETVREHFRTRVIGEKKVRRVQLGPYASCVFENRDTVLLQIQEMLRTERITRPGAIQHEIDTYNELIPAKDELSATVLVEIESKEERDRFLAEAKGLDRAFALVVNGEKVPAVWDAKRENTERTTAVHYLKFPLGERAAAALREVHRGAKNADAVTVDVTVEHPRYNARVSLAPDQVKNIAEDLVE